MKSRRRLVIKAFLQWLYIAFSHHNSYHFLELRLVKCQAPMRPKHPQRAGAHLLIATACLLRARQHLAKDVNRAWGEIFSRAIGKEKKKKKLSFIGDSSQEKCLHQCSGKEGHRFMQKSANLLPPQNHLFSGCFFPQYIHVTI